MISNKDLMRIAQIIAEASTCSRLNVGAVLTVDRRIISTGYNGNVAGAPHCSHIDTSDEACLTTVHAEMNAILFAARNGQATGGAVLFTTHAPCLGCSKAIVNAGISEVRYLTPYRIAKGVDFLRENNVWVYKVPGFKNGLS